MPPTVKRLNTLSVGIIGLGRIGMALGIKLSNFFKQVQFYDPYLSRGIEKSLKFKRFDNVYEMLKESDVVSINTDLNDVTRMFIDEDFIKSMKSEAILCNVARGVIFGEMKHIMDALREEDFWICN